MLPQEKGSRALRQPIWTERYLVGDADASSLINQIDSREVRDIPPFAFNILSPRSPDGRELAVCSQQPVPMATQAHLVREHARISRPILRGIYVDDHEYER